MGFESKRRLLKLSLLFLFAAATTGTAGSAGRTVFVALDKVAYLSGGTDLLKAQIERAVQSQSKPIDVSYLPTEITFTIHDLDRDRAFADNAEKYFANNPALSIVREPALTIRISYSEQALKTYRRDRLERDYSKLNSIVTGLRTLPAGVTVEFDADGAILRARDSTFADRLTKTAFLVVTPITKTSWRVTLPKDMFVALGPANRLATQRGISGLISYSYGDPVGMRTEQTDDGISVLIPDPSGNQAFVDRVKEVFAHDSDFALTESKALVFHISEAGGTATSSSLPQTDQTPPLIPMTMIAPGPLREVEKALDEIVNPALEIGAVGNSVSVRAKDQADVNRATALVRRALTDRTDIVIASQPDQSLLISLASGAHIVPPRPPLQPGQMLSTIKTRLNRLNLQATQIASIDNDHARVQLATADDAAIFRTALSRPSGFTIRLVDDANDNAATPPSPGDEKLQLPTKEYIWVSPRTIVTGDMIADAKVGISKFTESSIVTFHLTEEGRQRFGAATLENVGRRFVISVDGVAVEAPVIRDAILGGEGEISGGFTTEQAANLAQSMREHKDDLPLRAVDSDMQ